MRSVEFAIHNLPLGALSTYVRGAATARSVWGTFSAFQTSWGSTNSRTLCFSEAPQPHPRAVTIPTLCLLPMWFRRPLHTSGIVHCLSFHGWLVSFSTVSSKVVHVVTCQNFLLLQCLSPSMLGVLWFTHAIRRLANTALIPLPSFYSTDVKDWSCCVFCDPIGVLRKWMAGMAPFFVDVFSITVLMPGLYMGVV